MRTYFGHTLRREWDTRRWLFGVVLALELAVLIPAATYVMVIPGEAASDSVRPVAATQAGRSDAEPLPAEAEPAPSEPAELEPQPDASQPTEDAKAPAGEGESRPDEAAPQPQNVVPDSGGVSTPAPGSRDLGSGEDTPPQATGPRETGSGEDSPEIVGTPGETGEERGG